MKKSINIKQGEGGRPSTTGNPSGGNRSNNPPRNNSNGNGTTSKK